tara:strand:- start:3173 stop:4264 length:1092 start_codon:yes stop_codon:yes gene_type:complete
MKNIIIFYPSFERGGATKILFNLIKFFSKKKINIYLITNKISNDLKHVKLLKTLIIKDKNISFINNRIITSFKAAKLLVKLIKILDKDHTIIFSMQSNFFSTLIGFIFKFKTIIRVSEDPCGATKYADNKLFAYIILITKFLTYNLSYKIIANAKKSQECIKKFTYNKNKVIFLRNPTLNKLHKIKKTKSKKYFLNIGRYCKQKNQSFLIDTFYKFNKKNDNFVLILNGDGADKEKLKEKVNKLKLNKKVKFIGWKKRTDDLYKNAKLFILTSYYEGMPNVLIEALNNEIPVIAFNSSGVEDLLLGGKGGEIFFKMSSEELLDKIYHSLNNYDKALKKTYLAKKQLKKYSVEIAGQKYISNLK